MFIDNGCGMDSEILAGCLTIGSSTRLGDETGIGKFGIGLPFASIKQCTDIKVYSKTKTSKWQSISLNLAQLIWRRSYIETGRGSTSQKNI